MAFELANKSARTTRSGVVKFHVRSMTIVNSAFLTSRIFIGQLKEKPSESCQKDVKKLSKLIKLHQVATVRCIALFTIIF